LNFYSTTRDGSKAENSDFDFLRVEESVQDVTRREFDRSQGDVGGLELEFGKECYSEEHNRD
jgi:hypothetical protein